MVYTYPEMVAHIFAMTLTTDQTLFILYHYNSYANNTIMLRTPKPMVMRDVFLTRSSSFIPNPLSCVYVTNGLDCITNCLASWLLVLPIVKEVGWRHCAALYIGAGFFSSFAYIFAGQISKDKLSTKFDCACTSNGAYAAFATLSLAMPNCYIPMSKKLPIAWVGVPYLAKCAYDEYIGPRFIERRQSGVIELRNWGFIGGCSFALMYASLAFRTKTDFQLARVLLKNLHASKLSDK